MFDPSELERVYQNLVSAITYQYETRNGNREHRNVLTRSTSLLDLACKIPLKSAEDVV